MRFTIFPNHMIGKVKGTRICGHLDLRRQMVYELNLRLQSTQQNKVAKVRFNSLLDKIYFVLASEGYRLVGDKKGTEWQLQKLKGRGQE